MIQVHHEVAHEASVVLGDLGGNGVAIELENAKKKHILYLERPRCSIQTPYPLWVRDDARKPSIANGEGVVGIYYSLGEVDPFFQGPGHVSFPAV